MELTVRDLMEYLKDKNPESKICFYDSKVNDYVPMNEYLFKSVSKAKEDFRKHLLNVFSEIEDESERNDKIKDETSQYFKFVKDDDILLGLKNYTNTIDNHM